MAASEEGTGCFLPRGRSQSDPSILTDPAGPGAGEHPGNGPALPGIARRGGQGRAELIRQFAARLSTPAGQGIGSIFSAVSAEMMQRLSSKQDYSRALLAALPSRRPSVQAAAGARPALGGRGALGSPGRAALRGAAGDAAAGVPPSSRIALVGRGKSGLIKQAVCMESPWRQGEAVIIKRFLPTRR